MTHPNSLLAYRQIRADGVTDRRSRMILAWLREHGPASDREIMLGLGFVEPNAVRPRITTLVDWGAVLEVGSRKDVLTGKTVRVVSAALA